MGKRFLMCPPTYFRVNYSINPWMKPKTWDAGDWETANYQWGNLVRTLQELGCDIELITPVKDFPDMVFTANGGYIYRTTKRAITPQFKYDERKGEEQHFRNKFIKLGYHTTTVGLYTFEGAGDRLYDPFRKIDWNGTGFRSGERIYLEGTMSFPISENLTYENEMKLINPYYYHLDTCFCPLTDGEIMYYPEAFDKKSLEFFHSIVKKKHQIPIEERDAKIFAANAIVLNYDIVLHDCSDYLEYALGCNGYKVHKVNLSTFHKAGGSAACLTLELP